MLKKILIGIGIVIFLFILWVVYGLFIAEPVSTTATANYDENGLVITIDYSQPSKKGRLIFGTEESGALQPYGKYWRLGANASTDITFNQDVSFGGKAVEAGTYRMYAVPGEESFEVILNSESGVFFGAVEPDYEKDVVSVYAPIQETSSEIETFTIGFSAIANGANINCSWDDIMFSVAVTKE